MRPEDRYLLLSADCHAGAALDTYRDYLDPAWRDEFDAWRGQYSNPFRDLQGGGRTRNWDSARRTSELEADVWSARWCSPTPCRRSSRPGR